MQIVSATVDLAAAAQAAIAAYLAALTRDIPARSN